MHLSNRAKGYCLMLCQTRVLFWVTLYLLSQRFSATSICDVPTVGLIVGRGFVRVLEKIWLYFFGLKRTTCFDDTVDF